MKTIWMLFLLLFLSISCNETKEYEDKNNGIYYWKTEFRLGDWEKQFLKNHNIKKLYLRLFDVDMDQERHIPVPIATTRFADIISDDVEIIPVVYITTSAIKNIKICDYDTLLYDRIKAMGIKNGFPIIKEIQLDCDWSASSESTYFSFCERIRSLANKDGISLSSTLRLHQLKGNVPPVDRAVLMLYNTGSLYDPKTDNSILKGSDVKPYLKNLHPYPIPLSFSYPTYGWGILLRDGKFAAILHKTDFSNSSLYEEIQDHKFKVVKEHYLENKQLQIGDVIRLELSDMDEIKKVQTMVNTRLINSFGSIIYHLDSLNLSNFSTEEISSIFQ